MSRGILMLDINIYSIINSVIGACTLICLCLFLEKLIIRGRISSKIYFFIFLLILLRLLLPFEIVNKTYLVQIDTILPAIVRLLKTEIAGISVHFCRLNFSVSIFILIVLSFSLAALIKCLKIIAAYYGLHTRLKYVLTCKDEKILNILSDIKAKNSFHFKVKIIQNEFISSPFEFGLFQQTICLPDIKYTEDQLYFILSHELHHFKNKSNWFKLFNNILASIFWWNPLVLFYNTTVISMIEVNCDEHVITRFDDSLKAKYLTCLLSELRQHHNQKANGAIHFLSSDEKALSKRFRFITSERKRSRVMGCLSVLMVISIFFTSYAFMVLPYCKVLTSEIQTPKLTKENSYILRKGDGYIIYFENEPYIYLDELDESFSNLIIIDE